MASVAITPDQNTVIGEIFIAAPPARVFAALTDPSQMPRWWGQEGMYRITEWKADLRVGGKWSSVGVSADGASFRVEGEYLEVDPPRLLVHTWVASYAAPLKTIVRWELESQSVHNLYPSSSQRASTGTLVKLRHEGFASNPAAATRYSQGWPRVLRWLTDYLEKGETADTRHSN